MLAISRHCIHLIFLLQFLHTGFTSVSQTSQTTSSVTLNIQQAFTNARIIVGGTLIGTGLTIAVNDNIVVNNLSPGTEHTVVIQDASNTLNDFACTEPDEPAFFRISANDNQGFLLEFQSPLTSISRFSLDAYDGNGFVSTEDFTSSDTSAEFSGQSDTEYFFELKSVFESANCGDNYTNFDQRISAWTKPVTPNPPTINRGSSHSIIITFSQPSSDHYYNLYRNDSLIVTNVTTGYEDLNIRHGDVYAYQLQTFNVLSSLHGNLSSKAEICTKPSAPSSASVTICGMGMCRVEWPTPDSGLTAYKIEPANSFISVNSYVPPGLKYAESEQLSLRSRYVCPIDGNDEQIDSDNSVDVTIHYPPRSVSPRSLQVITSTSIEVILGSNQDYDKDNVKYLCSLNGAWEELIGIKSSIESSYIFQNLIPGTQYVTNCKASYQGQDSENGASNTITTKPDPVQSLRSPSATPTSITIAFEPPARGSYDGFIAQSLFETVSLGSGNVSYVFTTGLVASKPALITIYTYVANMISEKTKIVAWTAPEQPSVNVVPTSTESVQATCISNHRSVKVYWYKDSVQFHSGTQKVINVGSLLHCQEYQFECAIEYQGRLSAKSNTFAAAPYPKPPTFPTNALTVLSETAILLRWEVPGDSRYSNVDLKINNVEEAQDVAPVGFENLYTFTNLSPMQSYSITARSICTISTGSFRGEYQKAIVQHTPPPPTSILIRTIDTTSIQLQPLQSGDSFTYNRDGVEFSTTDLLYTDSNLLPGKIYKYTVKVTKNGAESNESEEHLACTNPTFADNIMQECFNHTSIGVVWSFPLIGNVSYWTIRIGNDSEVEVVRDQTGHVFSNLLPNTRYNIFLNAELAFSTSVNSYVCRGEVKRMYYATSLEPPEITSTSKSDSEVELNYPAWFDGALCIVFRNGTKLTSEMKWTYQDRDELLIPGTLYGYGIKCGTGDCFSLETLNIECTLPAKPSVYSFKEVPTAAYNVTVTWEEPEGGVSGYFVKIDEEIFLDVGLVSTHTFTSLNSSTRYSVCIMTYFHCMINGVNSIYNSTVECVIAFTAPSKPTVKACSPIDQDGIQVFPSVVDADPNIVFSGFVNEKLEFTNQRGVSGEATDLIPGEQYYIKAIAIFNNIESEPSDTILICPQPSPPIGVQAISNTFMTIRLEWSYPESGVASSYLVKEGSSDWIPADSLSFHEFTGLTPARSHTLRIKSKVDCYSCTSVNKTSVSLPFTITKCSTPSAPNVLAIGRYLPTTLSLRWDTGYDECDRTVIERNNLEVVTLTGLKSYNDENLIPGTKYSYQVRCEICDDVVHNTSDTIIQCTSPLPPDSCSADALSYSAIITSWVYPKLGIADGFFIEMDEITRVWANSSSDENVVFDNIASATKHTFCVKSFVNCAGSIGGIAMSSCRTCDGFAGPESPTASVLPIDTSSIQISMTDSNEDSSYVIFRDFEEIVTKQSKADFPHKDSGLNCGTEFSYFVQAVRNNIRNASDSVATCTYPGPPNTIYATTIDDSSLMLNWTTPECGYTGFRVQLDDSAPSTTGGNSFVWTGLASASQFPLRVNSYLSCTPLSADLDTPYSGDPIMGYTKPIAPTILSAAPEGTNEIDVSFYSTDIGVTFQMYRDETQVSSNAESIFSDTGLSPSTEYNYTITATKFERVSLPSSGMIVCTPPDIPTNLQFIPESISNGIFLWRAPSGGASFYIVTQSDQFEIPVHSVLEYNFTNLASPATCYDFKVKGVYTCIGKDYFNYSGIFAEAVSGCTKPTTPQFVQHTAISSTQLSLNFISFDPMGVINFTLTRAGQTFAKAVSPYEDSGLIGGNRYCYKLFTIAHKIQSDQTEFYCACTLPTTPEITEPNTTPTSIPIQIQGKDDFDSITYTANGTTTSTNDSTVTITISGLTAGTCYYQEVTAISKKSCLEAGSTVELLSKEAVEERFFCTIPNTPQIITIEGVSSASFVVAWSFEGAADYLLLTLDPNPGYSPITINDTTVTNYTFDALAVGTYSFSISAVSNSKQGDAATGTYAFPQSSGTSVGLIAAIVVAVVVVAVVTAAVIAFVIFKLISAKGAKGHKVRVSHRQQPQKNRNASPPPMTPVS